MIWFMSDTHFGHANVLKFTERPFADVHEMNRVLSANINAVVAPTDELYCLGDFSFKITVQDAADLRRRLNCRNIHLLPGNHDKDWTQPAVVGTFIVEPPICTLKHNGRKFVLCHYPMVDWQSFGHGSIHLHGHIHAPAAYNEWNRAERVLRYDVGIDANDLMPVSIDQVLAFFEGVEHRHRVSREQWLELARGAHPSAFDAMLPSSVAPPAAELDASHEQAR